VTRARAFAIAASCCMRCFSAAVGPVPMLEGDVGLCSGASSEMKPDTPEGEEEAAELSELEEFENQPMLYVYVVC